ncbi:hypothetical protein ABT095_05815 [Kitasatospora sp. NPDC002227]|uniref:hypothetical protein n=1 Tax=Kitasatospora sp. NPDC002227 TaxID=3154773 RepID=UPI00331799E7
MITAADGHREIPMSKPKKVLLWSLAAVVLLAGAGWFYTARSGATGPTPAEAAQARRLEAVLAGLLPQSESNRFNSELAARTERLIADCMRDKGLQYFPKDPLSLTDPETSTDFSSLAYAQTHGFGIAAWPTFAPSHENDHVTAALTGQERQRYDAALTSCSDSSAKRAAKEFGIAQGNADYDRTDRAVTSDPEYRRALTEWADCARKKGYDNRSRLDLINQLRSEYMELMKKINNSIPMESAPSQEELERRTKAEPAYQKFARKEIQAAVETFPCSTVTDSVYRTLFQHRSGLPAATSGSH